MVEPYARTAPGQQNWCHCQAWEKRHQTELAHMDKLPKHSCIIMYGTHTQAWMRCVDCSQLGVIERLN